MIPRVVIRTSRSGWVVQENNRTDDLIVFRSDEPERFIKYVAEKIAGVKLDRVVEWRLAEMKREEVRLAALSEAEPQ